MKAHEISVSEFKKHCLHLLQEVKTTGTPLVITKRAVPIAKVMSVNEDKNQTAKSYFGFLNNTVTINSDIVNFSMQNDWDINND